MAFFCYSENAFFIGKGVMDGSKPKTLKHRIQTYQRKEEDSMINKTTVVLMAALFMVLLPALSLAGTVDLPKTGQTTSYAIGDDGDIQAGVAWPYPRFTTNATDTTVTDNLRQA